MSSVQLAAAQEAPHPLLGLVIDAESWDTFWPEADALAREHWDEVDGGVEPRRRYAPDVARMRALSLVGAMQIFTARRDGCLVGYMTWMVMPDVESLGLVIAQQGAWFARQGQGQGIGFKLFEYSLASLKLLGVRCVFPHHRVQGRGSNIGKFFERWGAKKIQDTYCLWIGEK